MRISQLMSQVSWHPHILAMGVLEDGREFELKKESSWTPPVLEKYLRLFYIDFPQTFNLHIHEPHLEVNEQKDRKQQKMFLISDWNTKETLVREELSSMNVSSRQQGCAPRGSCYHMIRLTFSRRPLG